MFLTVIIFVAVLALLILIHELGHFLMAKKAGIKVEEFGLGFPPRLYGKQVGETTYSINLLPLGGFVRLYGEEGGHLNDKRSFASQTIWTRTKVIAAGVLMNFFLGLVILLIYLGLGNPPIVSDPAKFVPQDKIEYRTMVIEVTEDSPAVQAGIEPGDFIKQLDQQSIAKTEDLSQYTEKRPNQKVKVIFGPDGQEKTATVKLADIDGRGRLGVIIGQAYGQVGYHWWQIPRVALEETGRIIGLIFYYLYKILEKLIVQQQVEEGVVGPVGIFMLTKQIVQMGFSPLLRFIAFLSINLGVINLLPIPALDGGQLVLLGFEKMRGRKIRKSVEHGLQMFGFILLILLIILITYRDVVRLF
jgi:regulator of sigma E protease